jgi:hypothetical protein
MSDADSLSAALDTEIGRLREAARAAETAPWVIDASDLLHRALGALDAILAAHPLTATVRYAVACEDHAYSAIGARRDCPRCKSVEYLDGCRECRDEFGNAVRPEDCRARKAILAGLSGGEGDHG